MKIYDVTLSIKEGMLLWPGSPEVLIETVATVETDGWGESKFSFGSHTGTHIDAPNHFLENSSGVDLIDPEKLIGDCEVLDLTNLGHLEITPEDLKDISAPRVLFKTGNFKYLKTELFPEEYVSLSLEGADYLVKKGIVLVGTDFLGIEKRKNPGHPVHKALLSAEIVNVEGLDLSEAPAGRCQIYCLPIKVAGADGAPARVFLVYD